MSMLTKNSIYINGRGRIIPSTVNSYLQRKSKINPMTVNNAVLSVFSKINKDSNESFSALSNDSDDEDKELKRKTVQYTLGFGRTGLNRLIEEIRNIDIIHILIPALTALMEQVKDSEKALYLINNGIVPRERNSSNKTGLGTEENDDFEKYNQEETEDNPHVIDIRKMACITLRHLANLYQGNLAIVGNEILVEALKTIMCQHRESSVREEAAKTISSLCKNVLLARLMDLKYSITVTLMERIQKELHNAIKMIHFDALLAMLNCDAKGAIENNGIDIMRKLTVSHDKSIIRKAMEAISLMLIYLEDSQEGHKKHPLIKNTLEYFITNSKLTYDILQANQQSKRHDPPLPFLAAENVNLYYCST